MTALENATVDEVIPLLAPGWMPNETERDQAFAAVRRVEISAAHFRISLTAEHLDPQSLPKLDASRAVTHERDEVVLLCPISFARPRNSTTLIRPGAPTATPHVDRSLVRAVAMARTWMKRLDSGEIASIKALARNQRLCVLHTAKLLPLAYLAPDLVGQILEGRQPRTLTLTALIAQPLPLDWDGQRARFAAFA